MTPNELNELRAKHRAIVSNAKTIRDAAALGKRETTPDEDKSIDSFLTEAEAMKETIDAEAKAHEAKAAAARRNASIDNMMTGDDDIDAAAKTITGGTKRNDLAKTTYGFQSMGHFAAAVAAAANPSNRHFDARLPDFNAAVTGMGQTVPADGGFLVPPSFSTTIWDGLSTEPNAIMGLTDNYTVEGESLTFPANAETSRASTRRGGVLGYWIAEAAQITSSKPTFRNLKLEPQQLGVLIYVTEKLLRNSPVALDQYITRSAIEEIDFQTGDAVINGTGVGKPKGVMAAGSIISVAKETSQVAATFVKANANKMWSRLHPRSRPNAVWLMNVDVEPQLDDFNTLVKNVAGSENVGGFASMIYNAEKNTLKGRPIVFCEFCQTLGTTGDVILFDGKGYATGTRAGVDSQVSMHLRFDYAEMAFRFIYEVDGQPWLASALTPFKGSNTLSTFVKLDTRA